MPKKNKPTPWALRPGDELSGHVLLERPELGGIEHNAAFRVLLLQQRVGVPLILRQIVFASSMVVFVAGMYIIPRTLSGRVGPMMLSYLAVLLAYGFGLLFFVQPALAARMFGRSWNVPVLGSLTAQNMADLHLSGASSRDILLALWASRLRVSVGKLYTHHLRRLLIVLMLAAWGGAMAFPKLKPAAGAMFPIFAFLIGQFASLFGDQAAFAFNSVRQSIYQSQRKIAGRNFTFRPRLAGFIALNSVMPSLCFALAMFTPDSMLKYLLIFLALAPACAVCGFLAGRMLAAESRKHFEDDFAKALKDIEIIQRRVLEDLEKHPAQAQS